MPTYKDALLKFLPEQASLENFADSEEGIRLVHGFDRSLIWIGLLERTYNDQAQKILLASAHSKIVEIWALVPLRLVHSASASLRTVMDLLFSYSYYVYHPKEWSAICSGRREWEGRAGILDWHIRFAPCFREYNKAFGVVSQLDELHEQLSCFIHGIPALGLPMITSLDRGELDKTDVGEVIRLTEEADQAMNSFLIGAFHGFLPVLSPEEYKTILKGVDRTKLAECGITIPSA